MEIKPNDILKLRDGTIIVFKQAIEDSDTGLWDTVLQYELTGLKEHLTYNMDCLCLEDIKKSVEKNLTTGEEF